MLSGSDIDGDQLTFSIISGPLNGIVNLTDNNTGVFIYTPNENYNGTDSFTYNISDGEVTTETATVTFTINAIDDIPIASDIDIALDEDATISGTFLGVDVDSDEYNRSSLKFDGEGDYVDFGQGTDFNLNDFTISTYFKTSYHSTNGADWVTIFGSRDSYQLHLTGIQDSGGSRIRFGIEHTPGIGQYGMVASDLDVSNGEWNHVVITRDASSGEFVMYLNGSYVESHSDNLEGESNPSEFVI